jgi:hypothetical protein
MWGVSTWADTGIQGNLSVALVGNTNLNTNRYDVSASAGATILIGEPSVLPPVNSDGIALLLQAQLAYDSAGSCSASASIAGTLYVNLATWGLLPFTVSGRGTLFCDRSIRFTAVMPSLSFFDVQLKNVAFSVNTSTSTTSKNTTHLVCFMLTGSAQIDDIRTSFTIAVNRSTTKQQSKSNTTTRALATVVVSYSSCSIFLSGSLSAIYSSKAFSLNGEASLSLVPSAFPISGLPSFSMSATMSASNGLKQWVVRIGNLAGTPGIQLGTSDTLSLGSAIKGNAPSLTLMYDKTQTQFLNTSLMLPIKSLNGYLYVNASLPYSSQGGYLAMGGVIPQATLKDLATEMLSLMSLPGLDLLGSIPSFVTDALDGIEDLMSPTFTNLQLSVVFEKSNPAIIASGTVSLFGISVFGKIVFGKAAGKWGIVALMMFDASKAGSINIPGISDVLTALGDVVHYVGFVGSTMPISTRLSPLAYLSSEAPGSFPGDPGVTVRSVTKGFTFLLVPYSLLSSPLLGPIIKPFLDGPAPNTFKSLVKPLVEAVMPLTAPLSSLDIRLSLMCDMGDGIPLGPPGTVVLTGFGAA